MSQYSMKTYDHATLLKAAGLVAASAAGSVILDLGDGLMEADMVIDVTALEVATGDEIYTISLEGSSVAAMSSGSVELAKITLGNNPAPAGMWCRSGTSSTVPCTATSGSTRPWPAPLPPASTTLPSSRSDPGRRLKGRRHSLPHH
jgi:hypothetical protein